MPNTLPPHMQSIVDGVYTDNTSRRLMGVRVLPTSPSNVNGDFLAIVEVSSDVHFDANSLQPIPPLPAAPHALAISARPRRLQPKPDPSAFSEGELIHEAPNNPNLRTGIFAANQKSPPELEKNASRGLTKFRIVGQPTRGQGVAGAPTLITNANWLVSLRGNNDNDNDKGKGKGKNFSDAIRDWDSLSGMVVNVHHKGYTEKAKRVIGLFVSPLKPFASGDVAIFLNGLQSNDQELLRGAILYGARNLPLAAKKQVTHKYPVFRNIDVFTACSAVAQHIADNASTRRLSDTPEIRQEDIRLAIPPVDRLGRAGDVVASYLRFTSMQRTSEDFAKEVHTLVTKMVHIPDDVMQMSDRAPGAPGRYLGCMAGLVIGGALTASKKIGESAERRKTLLVGGIGIAAAALAAAANVAGPFVVLAGELLKLGVEKAIEIPDFATRVQRVRAEIGAALAQAELEDSVDVDVNQAFRWLSITINACGQA